jgi:hypothetical protein
VLVGEASLFVSIEGVWGYEVERWSEMLRCARWEDANFWPGLSSATSD